MSAPLRVFLSHSMSGADGPLLLRLGQEWREAGIEVYLAERDFSPTTSTEKIRNAMARSDVVVVLLTQAGSSSSWVITEVGIAIEQSKPIVPLVEEGVDPPGPIRERDQIRFNRDKPDEAFGRATDYMKSLSRPETAQPSDDPFVDGLVVGVALTLIVVLIIVALARK